MLAVDHVSLRDGRLTYRDLSADTPAEYVLQDLNIELTSVRLGETPVLHLGTLCSRFSYPVTL